MNNKNFLKIFLSVFFILLSPSLILAADLEITCYKDQKPVIVKNTNPLFSLDTFLPGNTEKKEIYINNTDNENPCKIYISGSGKSSKLGDKIIVEISDSIYNGTLSKFVSTKKIQIADLKPETNITRTFSLYLEEDTGNDLMNKSISFDIVIDSEWGASSTSDTADVEGIEDTSFTNKIAEKALEVLGIGGGDNLIDTSTPSSQDSSVLGDNTENTCTTKTLWWIPLVVQLFLTTLLMYIKSSFLDKSFVRIGISIILAVISYFAIEKIGCGCNVVWFCTYHWILNVLIGTLPIFRTKTREEYPSGL